MVKVIIDMSRDTQIRERAIHEEIEEIFKY